MMYRRGNVFNIDRKMLYAILSVVIVLVLSLTIVYATLSTTLQINGQADVLASNWDIHLDNVQLNSMSASKNLPTITSPNTATFSSELKNPGDFYEFTIDVVNDGSLDAMIDGITKTPELSATQKKYLNYIVEYQNGEAITTKQLVKVDSFVRLKVRIEFRSDIPASDLPSQEENLNLSFIVNYVQSDETGSDVLDNGAIIKKSYEVVSGDINTIGSVLSIGNEQFYLIKNDGENISMLAMYNLHVGNVSNEALDLTPLTNPTGIQNSTAKGWITSVTSQTKTTAVGVLKFSDTAYWTNPGEDMYVYNSNSTLYNYVESYRSYLESQGAEIEDARIINPEEVELIGCSLSKYLCDASKSWAYSTSYWTGISYEQNNLYCVMTADARLVGSFYSIDNFCGVRPVIVVKA